MSKAQTPRDEASRTRPPGDLIDVLANAVRALQRQFGRVTDLTEELCGDFHLLCHLLKPLLEPQWAACGCHASAAIARFRAQFNELLKDLPTRLQEFRSKQSQPAFRNPRKGRRRTSRPPSEQLAATSFDCTRNADGSCDFRVDGKKFTLPLAPAALLCLLAAKDVWWTDSDIQDWLAKNTGFGATKGAVRRLVERIRDALEGADLDRWLIQTHPLCGRRFALRRTAGAAPARDNGPLVLE